MDNKTLIENISLECGLKKEETQKLLGDLFGIFGESLLDMDSIIIPGFGQFETKKRKERVTNHPSSGRKLLVPPKMTVCFKPSGLLKTKVK